MSISLDLTTTVVAARWWVCATPRPSVILSTYQLQDIAGTCLCKVDIKCIRLEVPIGNCCIFR